MWQEGGTADMRVLVGKPEERRELGKHRRRWKITLILMFKKWDGVCT
jgi:hypothetical protein